MKNLDHQSHLTKANKRRVVLLAMIVCVAAILCFRLTRPAEAAITVVRTGVAPNFVVTFNNDSAVPLDNRLELRFNAANQLEWSVNGGSFTTDLGGGATATFANIATIVSKFGSSSNTFVLTLQQLGTLAAK